MNKRFGLAIIFNDAYVPGALVFLKTFFKYNDWYKGDIIIIHDNKYCTLSKENKNLFINQFPNVYFHCVEDHIYDKFVEHFYEKMYAKRFTISGFTLEAFALKYDRDGNEYDRIVYLDIDQIVEGNIEPIFKGFEDCIITAPGDNVIINDTRDVFYKRTKESISGGLFAINKKYLGTEIRDEILKFGENFKIDNPEYGDWDGRGFEMHVLNVWLLDKNVLIAPSIYAYPSPLLEHEDWDKLNISSIIRNELFKKSKIIHIWDVKPWVKKENDYIYKIDAYWWYIYNSLIKGTEKLKTLKEFYSNMQDVSEYYKNYDNNDYRILSYIIV